MQRFIAPKDPNSTLDYQLDWSEWLGGDTIQTSVWTVPAGLTYESDSNTSTSTTVWVSGGTDGSVHIATNRVTTAGGRIADRSITFQLKER